MTYIGTTEMYMTGNSNMATRNEALSAESQKRLAELEELYAQQLDWLCGLSRLPTQPEYRRAALMRRIVEAMRERCHEVRHG